MELDIPPMDADSLQLALRRFTLATRCFERLMLPCDLSYLSTGEARTEALTKENFCLQHYQELGSPALDHLRMYVRSPEECCRMVYGQPHPPRQ